MGAVGVVGADGTDRLPSVAIGCHTITTFQDKCLCSLHDYCFGDIPEKIHSFGGTDVQVML